MNTHCKNGIIGGGVLAIGYPMIFVMLISLSDVYWDSDISETLNFIAFLPLAPIISFWPFPDVTGGPVLADVLIIITSSLIYLFILGLIAGILISVIKNNFFNQ